jgi:hypothetical protein
VPIREVPKTLIFAKDDSHAEDIVRIFRQEFGKGDDFCQKITYLTTGRAPKDLIQDFRNSFNPRIAVTVDMIATGTDIKPVEIVMFMVGVASCGRVASSWGWKLLEETLKMPEVILCKDCKQSINKEGLDGATSRTPFLLGRCPMVTRARK